MLILDMIILHIRGVVPPQESNPSTSMLSGQLVRPLRQFTSKHAIYNESQKFLLHSIRME